MKCTVNDLNLSFDKDNKLRTTIGRVTGWDINKAYVLAAQLQNSAFKKYLSENLTENDILKGADVDINNITEADYVNINQNKLGSLLNAYYLRTYHSVNNTKTNKAMGRLMGFSSSTAKKIAKDYVADMIISRYQSELNKPRNVRKSNGEILQEVHKEIRSQFLRRADDFAKNVLSTDKYSNEAKEYAQKYLDIIDKINQVADEIDANVPWLRSMQGQLNEYKNRELTVGEKKEYDALKADFDERRTAHRRKEQALAQHRRDRRVMAANLIDLYSSNIDGALNVRNRNFVNLYMQVIGNPEEFFFEVYNTKKMTNLIKEYDKIGDITEYIEEEDSNNDSQDNQFNEQSIDETSKTWEDNLYKNFNQAISTKMKFILSRIPKLESPFNPKDEVQAVDTNNELGVETYYDSQYLTVQMIAHGDFSNVESMISSLEEKSKNIKALYGLGSFIDKLKQDRNLANFVYSNFAKPLVNKVMCTINDVTATDGIVFDYSNPNAFGNVKLAFDMMNKLRSTYNNNYDVNDASVLTKLSRVKESDIDSIKPELQTIISKYFPNFDVTNLDNIFRLPNKKEVINSIIRDMISIVNGIGNIKRNINNTYDRINREYSDALSKWNTDYLIAEEQGLAPEDYPQYPKKEEFDVSLYELTPIVNQSIIRFANTISRYNESRARMNTANAEGNTASDVIKNCFVTRFFDMILAESPEDSAAGLKAFGEYLIQGTKEGTENQYSNNPIFFGLKDENGVVIAPGMFTKTSTGFVINGDPKDGYGYAKNILSYALFDGVKNSSSGVGTVYDKMSKIDFFITQYIAFSNSTVQRTENGNIKKIGNLDSAVYPMRIGSDAPKIFMIRAPKYNRAQAELAFFNHFLDEMNMFVQAINNLFTNENGRFVTKTSVNGLVGRAYFDEKAASEIRKKGGTDFTEAIVKNGRLVGNMFKFNRLFDTTSYSFGKEIENVLSLYGGGREGMPALFTETAGGKLQLNEDYLNRENSFLVVDGNKVRLNLSAEQRTYIKGMVSKWTTAFLEDSRNEIADYIEALKEQKVPHTEQSINSFLLNSAVMNMNYDDMFEGDFKYYNNARDFLKRTKETQAGGESYENCSATDSMNEITDITWNGSPAIINIKQTKNGVASAYEVPTYDGKVVNPKGTMIARTGWRAVTIYNTIKPADEADELQKFLEQEFIKQGMNRERAHNRSVKIAQGYWDNTTANDAQSFITFEEFIRRKEAEGSLDEYQDLIAQILDPDVSAEEIDLDAINARIQVQKNFYFDKVFDAETNQFIPRQIKNAEFVLIPKLLPADSQLKKVYDWMRANDIGQLNTAETDKAAKKNIFTIWDEQTGEFDKDFESKFSDSYIQTYKYKYLYKQQDVPQHMVNEENKLGSQISKKIVDNVTTASKQVQDWADEYQEAYTANIREDFLSFLEAMGWELDKSGKIVNSEYATTDADGNPLNAETIKSNREILNLTDYYARARQEAVRLGMDSNFMEYLIPDEFGKPVMPNAMNNVQQKLESVGQALFNRAITRQTLPGWHAAQITGIGYSKKLNFNPETGVMEIYLPRWSNLIPKGKTVEENEAILKQIEEAGLDIHLGYRIPTEGKQSISVLKVVGFTNDALGSTIVVPDAWVTQTGSDFDVDSIYGIAWELYRKKGKDGKYTVHKVPYEKDTTDDRMLYVNYVNQRLDNKVKRNDLGEEIDSVVKEVKARIRGEQKEANAKRTEFDNLYKKEDAIRNEIYKKRLPGWARGIIKDINATAKKRAKESGTVVDLTDAYPTINEKLTEYLSNHTLPVEEVQAVQNYLDQQTTLLNIINAQRGLYTFNKEDYFAEKTDAIKQAIEDNINAWIKDVETEAGKVGIMSFEEFKTLPFVERLSRRARNNYILDRMIKIMNDASSREEQYGRSQFEDIAGEDHSANDIINKISGTTSKLISPYNPLTQLDYFDDAMGGAGLKARSVNWDTMASKSNRAHGYLSDDASIYAVLNLDGASAKDSAITYDEADIKAAYKEDMKDYSDNDKTISLVPRITETKEPPTRRILIDELGETPVYITEERLKQLQPIAARIDNDENVFYVDWRTFVPYAYDMKFTHHYTYDGSEDIRHYKATDEIKDLIYDITGEYPNFVKGKVAITQAIWDLLTNTTPNEFFAIINNYEEVAGYDINIPLKERKITMKVINDYVKKEEEQGNTVTDEDIAKIIKNTNIKGQKIISKSRYPISKALVESKTFASKYPKAHSVVVELYNAENGITPTIGEQSSKQIIVKFNKFGWSNNNKNITGNYVTTYTAETTAHHLDAVKRGSIPNVNAYTFDIYKLITCIGLDHEFSVGFMRQPIISRLVANYNLTNSVFFGDSGNPVDMTIADIAADLGLGYQSNKKNEGIVPIDKHTSLGRSIKALKEDVNFVTAFNNIFGVDISSMENNDIMNIKFPLRKDYIFQRIRTAAQNGTNKIDKTQATAYNQAAIDLSMLITFRQMQTTAQHINNIIQFSAVDKVGAKPSNRETRRIRDAVNEYRTNPVFKVGDKTWADAMFPLDENGNIDVNASVNKPIAAAYAYSTLPSIQVGAQVFITENDDFVEAENHAQSVIGRRFNEQEYKEWRRYGMTYLYNSIGKLLTPLMVDERGRIILFIDKTKEAEIEPKTANIYWNDERSRIVGYGVVDEGNFTVDDINHPTDVELAEYIKLTPAQKVLFIQRNFPDNQGIFNYIKVSLLNNTYIKNKGLSRQYLSYDDQVDSIEDLFQFFRNSFSNHNPLIKLACVDLIKYAFIAEGFNFRSGYITKIIPNDALYTDVNQGGMDIINNIDLNHAENNGVVRKLRDLPGEQMDESYIDLFVRSHPEIVKTVRLGNLRFKTDNEGNDRMVPSPTQAFISATRPDGLVVLDNTSQNPMTQALIDKLRIKNRVNGYVKVDFPTKNENRDNILYLVVGGNPIDPNNEKTDYKDYYLVPLNLLEKYETYEVSYNERFNRFNTQDYYIDKCNELEAATEARRTAGSKTVVADANRTVIATKQKIGTYRPSTGKLEEVMENPMALQAMAASSDAFLKGGAQMLTKPIAEKMIPRVLADNYNAMYILDNNNLISQYIPEGKSTVQRIFDENNNSMEFTIAHLPKKNKIRGQLKSVLNGKINIETERGKDEYNYIIKQLKDTATSPLSANVYRVSPVQRTNEEQKETIRNAATVMIDDNVENTVNRDDVIGNSARRGTDIDSVSAAIIKQITFDARKNNSDIATTFIRNIERRGVNKNFRSSLAENRGNIYTAAARYYQTAANTLINKINSFELLGENYDMSEEELYNVLAQNPEYFPEVAKIILDAVTFGNRVDMIFSLDIAAEDKETKDAIENIRRSINSLRTNTKVRMAMNNLINIYFKRYSTNPMIIEGLMNIRDQFGDIDTTVKLISDPTEINNTEVQVILKQIYTMFSRAEMFETKKNVKEWKEELEKIDAILESIDMNKVIDFDSFRLRQDYNEKYIEDRNKVLNEYHKAKNHRFDSIEAFGDYLRKQYARDKFMYEHTEQPIIADYYKEDLENRQIALEQGGRSYIEYRMLSAQLYESNNAIESTDEESSNRIDNIRARMSALKSITNAAGAEKPIDLKKEAEAINNFLTKRREINEKYFNSQEYDGFQETYQRYNSFIKSYDNKHSEESLDTKLENAEYREAYEWIKNNGRLGFTKEASDKIAAAFKTLVDRTTAISSKTRLRLKNIKGAIDDSGTINPIALTDEQIALLKEEEESELSIKYTNGDGEMILIKDVPKNIPLRFRKKKAVKYKQDPDKAYTIGRINQIISKATNHDTGKIDIATLFNNEYVTDTEREELARLYEHLYDRGVDNSNEVGIYYTWEVNEDAYNTAMNYYNLNLKNTKQGKQFLRIVTHLGVDGKVRPNLFLYGYKVPFDDVIDKERTDAFYFIQDNIEFVPTEYYYEALNKASAEGRYDEWFEANHIYNPFTHRYEPLKIWTRMQAKPNSELAKSVEYVPSFDNMERSVKPEYINSNYKEFSSNYKRGDGQYDSSIKRNKKEQAMYDLIQRTLNKYATTYQGKRFVGQGYLPRERETQVNGRWALGQIAALFGASWHSGADSDSFHETIDYSHDRDAEMNMLQLLKDKGSKEYKKLPNRIDFENDDDYRKALETVREENRHIAEENRKIDNKIVNKDFRKVMEDFVYNATIFNSRQAAKPYLYLLLEDLAVNNAYMIKGMWNKRLIKDYDTSTRDDSQYRRIQQNNTRDLIHNLARRLLYNQYHDTSTLRTISNFMQNLTSAKYMVFNLYGGIANVATGKVNIAMEEFANEYFGFKEFAAAERKYLTKSHAFIASAFTDKAPNLIVALCKQFKVVDFDQVLQFGATADNLDARMRKVRNFMYSFQSSGEHFMQNSVLLAMLASNRLYTDSRGNIRIGDFKDYTWDVEDRAMRDVLAKHGELLTNYELYRKSIGEYNVETRLELSMGRKDLNRNFLYSLRDSVDPNINALYKKIAEEYHKKREELMKTAKEEFNTNPTVESLYTYSNGEAVIKDEAYEKIKGKVKDPHAKLETLVAEFREKVKAVNKKIHGVYDKDGAALIESKWWGSLVMQYHKHLPTGIWKRWRRKGYYSEFRGSMERGTYQTLIDFIGTEFTNFKTRRNKKQENGTNIALASVQVAIESAINTFINIKFNWNNLSNWERANVRRNLAEVAGVLAACLTVMALYGLSDDDDINDDRFKASLLYLADRLYSETTMYGPQGLISEAKTNWSQPVASLAGVNDLIKAITLIPQALFDPDYNPEYQSGRYAGMNKFEVLWKRNTVGLRNLDRILTIDKNNSYYKLEKSQIGISIAKSFGDTLAERD